MGPIDPTLAHVEPLEEQVIGGINITDRVAEINEQGYTVLFAHAGI